MVGREGFEPSTFRLSAERSSQAELPAQQLYCLSIEEPTIFKGFRIPSIDGDVLPQIPFFSI